MVLAIKNLKEMFSNLHHVTCLCHAIHNLCDKIRKDNPLANKFIGLIKEILSKWPQREQINFEITNLNLPPSVILTRWGTWIKAANFYAENFDKIELFLNEIQSKSQSIKTAKLLMKDELLKKELLIVHDYNFLPNYISKLEAENLKVKKQIKIVTKIQNKLEKLDKKYLEKFNSILNDNPDLIKSTSSSNDLNHLLLIKYAPLTWVNVERSFSIYNNILAANRQSLSIDSIKCMNNIKYNNFLWSEFEIKAIWL